MEQEMNRRQSSCATETVAYKDIKCLLSTSNASERFVLIVRHARINRRREVLLSSFESHLCFLHYANY